MVVTENSRVRRAASRSAAHWIRRMLPAFWLLAASVAATAQITTDVHRSDALARPRFMLFLLEIEPDTMSEQQAFVLYSSILTAAAAATDAVVIRESPDADVPPSSAAREAIARAVNADSILHVIASGGFENLTVELVAYDLLRGTTVWRDVIRPGFRVDLRVLTLGLWEPLETALRDSFVRIVEQTPLTIFALPGSIVTGLPGSEATVDDTGRLATSVPALSVLTLSATLPGHYQEQSRIFVGIDPTELSFEQIELAQFGIDTRLSSLQFPGARFWYYAAERRVFLRAAGKTQYFGIFPIDNSERLFRVGSPLSFLGFDVGVYLNQAERRLRPFVATGGYVRIVHPSFSDIDIDRNAASGAMTFTLGGEYMITRRWRFLIEYEPALIFADDPERFIDLSFVRNRFPDGEVPGLITFDRNLIDLRNVWLGVRWDF